MVTFPETSPTLLKTKLYRDSFLHHYYSGQVVLKCALTKEKHASTFELIFLTKVNGI